MTKGWVWILWTYVMSSSRGIRARVTKSGFRLERERGGGVCRIKSVKKTLTNLPILITRNYTSSTILIIARYCPQSSPDLSHIMVSKTLLRLFFISDFCFPYLPSGLIFNQSKKSLLLIQQGLELRRHPGFITGETPNPLRRRSALPTKNYVIYNTMNHTIDILHMRSTKTFPFSGLKDNSQRLTNQTISSHTLGLWEVFYPQEWINKLQINKIMVWATKWRKGYRDIRSSIFTILQMEHLFAAPFSPQVVQKSASMKPICPVMACVSTDRAVGSLPCWNRTGEAPIHRTWFSHSSWDYDFITLPVSSTWANRSL